MKKTKSVIISVILLLFLLNLVPKIGKSQNLSPLDKNEITNLLKYQEFRWNDGDIDGYMEGYLDSDSLKFITKKGIT